MEIKEEVVFDWLDSNTLFLDSEQNLTKAGTVIRLNNNLFFLKEYSSEQLLSFKKNVIEAINYELNLRKK